MLFLEGNTMTQIRLPYALLLLWGSLWYSGYGLQAADTVGNNSRQVTIEHSDTGKKHSVNLADIERYIGDRYDSKITIRIADLCEDISKTELNNDILVINGLTLVENNLFEFTVSEKAWKTIEHKVNICPGNPLNRIKRLVTLRTALRVVSGVAVIAPWYIYGSLHTLPWLLLYSAGAGLTFLALQSYIHQYMILWAKINQVIRSNSKKFPWHTGCDIAPDGRGIWNVVRVRTTYSLQDIQSHMTKTSS
jgi:hypothetical protein